jgi:hypothetical protein
MTLGFPTLPIKKY